MKYTPPPAAKKKALDDALYAKDKVKATKIFNEIKSFLTPEYRDIIKKGLAKLPSKAKPKK